MRLRISELSTLDSKRWDDFVDESGSGTTFSKSAFFTYHDIKKNVVFIQVEDSDRIVGGAVGCIQSQGFSSPCGASYGGFFTRKTLSFEKKAQAWSVFCAYIRETAFSSVTLTYPPSVYNPLTQDEDIFLAKYHGFAEKKSLYSSVLLLKSQSALSYDPKLRNKLNQAQRNGLSFLELDSLDAFYDLLVQNKQKFDQKPAHSRAELERLRAIFPEDAMYLGAFDSTGILLAGTFVLKCNASSWLFFYIVSGEDGRSAKAVPWLIDQVIKRAGAEKITILDFGVSHETSSPNPMEPKFSLIRFKENFGARGWIRPTLYYSNT